MIKIDDSLKDNKEVYDLAIQCASAISKVSKEKARIIEITPVDENTVTLRIDIPRNIQS